QVITLEDALTMIDLSSPIAFIACDCRRQKYGYVEKDRSRMTCLGLGIGMFRYERLPARYIAGAEFVSDKEAKEWLQEWNKNGIVHTLMTFGLRNGAPYIGGICNCTYADCLSINWRLNYGIKQLLKGERVATLAPEKCNGCNGNFLCIRKCQFGALSADIRQNKVHIDLNKCFGCGVCANSCNKSAINLLDRRKFEVLKYDW
ncbi:MAG: 4Fe-4S ferredoxin, partial [Candidatus Helarchaeota archaeon]|nr:4Fe-4S ferredoxin [Candidatus Helarchaeota archaeon]